jgi:chromosome segregation and condensation protein ScpB
MTNPPPRTTPIDAHGPDFHHPTAHRVEAALMAANQPLTLAQLHGLFSLDDPAPDDSVEQALETLREQCADRGVELVELASGFRFQVKADVHPWVARLWTERQTKYTRATLETLGAHRRTASPSPAARSSRCAAWR